MAFTAPVFTSRASRAPFDLGLLLEEDLGLPSRRLLDSDWMRNGAMVPRGRTSATFVRRVQAISAGATRAR